MDIQSLPSSAIANIAKQLLSDNPKDSISFKIASKYITDAVYFTPADKAVTISTHFSPATIIQRIVTKRLTDQWKISYFYLHGDPNIHLDYCVRIEFSININGSHNTIQIIYRKSALGLRFNELNLTHFIIECSDNIIHVGVNIGIWHINKRTNKTTVLTSIDIQTTWKLWRTIIYAVHTIIENDWWTYRIPFKNYISYEMPTYPFMTYCFRSNSHDLVTTLYSIANRSIPPPSFMIMNNLNEYTRIKQEVSQFLGTRTVDSHSLPYAPSAVFQNVQSIF